MTVALIGQKGGRVTKPIPTEDEEQKTVFSWAAYFPKLKWMHHISNESKVPVQYRVKLKAMGLKSGVADIFLPLPRNGYHGLYIEMKRTKGSKTSDIQKEFIEDMNKEGYKAVICKGAGEAIETIKKYMEE